MICWAVPSSLGAWCLESVWADPVESDWDEGGSRPVVGSDRGMTSMASAAERQDLSIAVCAILSFTKSCTRSKNYLQ